MICIKRAGKQLDVWNVLALLIFYSVKVPIVPGELCETLNVATYLWLLALLIGLEQSRDARRVSLVDHAGHVLVSARIACPAQTISVKQNNVTGKCVMVRGLRDMGSEMSMWEDLQGLHSPAACLVGLSSAGVPAPKR